MTIGVVILCHNYGHYLTGCVESVLAQTFFPQDIVIVDDASEDQTPEIAAKYAPRSVRYKRIEDRNLHVARRVGVESLQTEVVCFVDADDLLTPQYLERGIVEFTEPDTAVVYSDVEWFGTRCRHIRYPSQFDRPQLQRDNYMHAGSLSRREAVLASGAFDVELDHRQHVTDWFLWRRVLTGRWTARKQTGIYRYRQHSDSLSMNRRSNGGEYNSYFRRAALDLEPLTLFVPLSGRRDLWPRMSRFLEQQVWPHTQIRLTLCDTSQDRDFSQDVRLWMARCDYSDVRYLPLKVGRAGLANENRKEAVEDVRLAMCRIYYQLAQELTTNYVWILEDDVLPPLDVCERLLRGFDPDTVSVSAPYRSRFHEKYVAWDARGRNYHQPGSGCQTVGGNGFGCVILRRFALDQFPFQPTEDFDHAFYRKLNQLRWKAKVDWCVACEHGATSPTEEEQDGKADPRTSV